MAAQGYRLTISKSLAELMGCQLTVESEPGNGSTFSFHLQLEVANAQPEMLTPAKPLIKNVLIVDDNATNRQLMQEIFSNWGDFRTCRTQCIHHLKTNTGCFTEKGSL